jgi:uncharacterized membrane protein YgcG
LPAEGICVVGSFNSDARTAKILTDDSLVFEVPYFSSSYLLPGEVYRFTRMDEVVKLAQLQLTGSYGNPWGPRMIDNAELEKPDCVYVNDGKRGYVYELTEDFIVFIRYSNTEYRILKGSDVITVSDWPCWAHFNTISAPADELEEEYPSIGTIILFILLVLLLGFTRRGGLFPWIFLGGHHHHHGGGFGGSSGGFSGGGFRGGGGGFGGGGASRRF